jgi:hypothetical protein
MDPTTLIEAMLKTKYSRNFVNKSILTFHKTISGTESKSKSIMIFMTLNEVAHFGYLELINVAYFHVVEGWILKLTNSVRRHE